MVNNRQKRAFSLTELLIVLVIITIVFLAMTPIVVKRGSGEGKFSDPVWNFSYNEYGDIYFDPGTDSNAGASIGVEPSKVNNYFKDMPAKLLINSFENHPAIAFYRTAGTSSRHVGILKIDNKGNLISTTNFVRNKDGDFNTNDERNTVLGTTSGGYTATGTGIENGIQDITAVGYNVLQTVDSGIKTIGSGHTLIGAKQGSYVHGKDSVPGPSTMVGASDNETHVGNGYSNNVVLGHGNTVEGNDSVVVGTNITAKSKRNSIVFSTQGGDYKRNISAIPNTLSDNMINIGNPKNNKNPKSRDTTSIGYNSCLFQKYTPTSPSATAPKVTCIGYESGNDINHEKNVPINMLPNFPSAYKTPSEHVYLGGSPYVGKDHGDVGAGVLEIHSNMPGSKRPTVILNSHLVVRGKTFFSNLNTDPTKEYRELGDVYGHSSNVGITSGTGTGAPFISYTGMMVDSSRCDRGGGYDFSNCLSDIRLKENITPNADAIEKILQVIPYNYTFKDDKLKTPQVGVIAQDLEKYSPNSVTKDDKGFLKIRWDEMFFAAINAIKNLYTKVCNLNNEIDTMENNLKDLISSNKSAQKRLNMMNKRLNKLERTYGE